MTTRRITISLPAETADRVKKAAGDTPVSAWVTEALEARLDDVELERLWEEFYLSVKPRAKDVRRAEAMFRRLTGAPRRQRAA